MDEYISREETVKKIEEKLKVDDLMSLAEEVWTNNCLKIVLRAIMAVETAYVQPVFQWISVKERQPDKDDLYLVAVENEICVYIDIADYSNNQWHKHDEVIYWQPLPELPKES